MSSDNPDIRAQVEANRGTTKKLELLIPGLSKYRKLEDIRVADDILRNQVSDKLNQTKSNLESLRKQMVNAGDFTNLTAVGSLISQVQQISGEVRHSEQGYSGIAATFQFDQAKLDKLYDYDYDFVSSAMSLLSATSGVVYDPTNTGYIQAFLSKIGSLLSDFKQKWTVRIEAIQNILVK